MDATFSIQWLRSLTYKTDKEMFERVDVRRTRSKPSSFGSRAGRSQPHSPGWVRVPFSSFFLKFQSTFLIFPKTLFIFFLILALRVGESPTREGPGYATVRFFKSTYDFSCQIYLDSCSDFFVFAKHILPFVCLMFYQQDPTIIIYHIFRCQVGYEGFKSDTNSIIIIDAAFVLLSHTPSWCNLPLRSPHAWNAKPHLFNK